MNQGMEPESAGLKENQRGQAHGLPEALLAGAPMGFAYLDRELRFLSVNKWLADINGLSVEAHIGKSVWDVVPTLGAQAEAVAKQILTTGQAVRDHEFAGEAPTTPGEQRWWKESWYPVRDEEGDIIGFGVMAEDITDRKRAEEQLQRNHDTFYRLIQDNPFGVYLVDADFRLRQVSLGAQKVFTNVRPLLGRDFAEVLRQIWPEPFASEAIDIFRRTLQTGEPYVSYSMVEQRRDIGEVEAYDWRIDRIVLPDGRFGVVCYFYDLSERQRLEGALRESEERFRAFVTATSDVVYSMSPDWSQMVRLYGRKFIAETETRTEGWLDKYIPVEDQPQIKAVIQEAIRTKSVFQLEHRVIRVDGSIGWTFSRAVPLLDANGEITEWFGAARDVTDQKEAESALAKAQAELKQHAAKLEVTVAERTAELQTALGDLETYSYSIAHDMRSPLRGMQGFSKLLLEEHATQLDDEAVQYLKRIATSAERLDRLIQDVLSYSKIVRGDLKLEPIQPGPLLEDIIESYPHLQKMREGITIEEPLPSVIANRAALTQVFSNLLGNALKFVAAGVVPRVAVTSEVSGDTVRFWVSDNGIGIEPQARERIFHLFQRLNGKEIYEGTGLGLAIVRKAVERMDGAVGVESEPGQGSRFWFELKRADS